MHNDVQLLNPDSFYTDSDERVNNVIFIYAFFHDSQRTLDYLGSNGRMSSVKRTLTCIIQPLDCDVTARVFFAFKCPCLHLCMPAFLLSSLKSYI